jgi:hypothetical protein
MLGFVTLCEDESILYIARGCPEAQEQRFLGIVREIWQMVPEKDRKTILEYYPPFPRVILEPRAHSKAPIASTNDRNFLIWADSLRILSLPGGETWTKLAIAEELAHAVLIASRHPTHTSIAPSDPKQLLAWDEAREEQMRQVLGGWPFDLAEHARMIAWVRATKGGLISA